MRCNFLGDAVLFQAVGTRILRIIGVAAFVSLAGVLIWWAVQQGRIATLVAEVSVLEVEVQNKGAELKSAEQEGAALRERLAQLIPKPGVREAPFRAALSLSQLLPLGAWVREVRFSRGTMKVRGFVDTRETFNALLDRFQGAPHIEGSEVHSIKHVAWNGRNVDEFVISVQMRGHRGGTDDAAG